jgi:type IV pilus assembly protein PilQ
MVDLFYRLHKRINNCIARPGAAWIKTILCLALCLPSIGWAKVVNLDAVKFNALPGNKVQVKLELSGPLSREPLSFTIDDPARIALDLPDTRLNLPAKNQPIGVGTVRSLNAVEAGGRTRVVLNLSRLVPYGLAMEGNTVVITLGSEASSTSGGVMPAITGRAHAMRDGASIEDVDFRRGKDGEGRIIVALSDPSATANVRQEGGKILVDFVNVRVPERLDRRLDVIDFATPVKEIDILPRGNSTQMVVSPLGEYEHLAYQSDNLFTLEVRPLTREQQEVRKKEQYTGERLSLNFQNIEVRAVLQLLADFSGLNLVASDSVAGNVTLRLKNVPWDQALDIILKSRGLGMRQVDNVMMVAPQEEITAREKLELESQTQLAELAPLRTEFVQINYAKASDIAGLLKAEANNLLSARGNVSVDERTNTLLVQDTADKLAEMRKVVGTLDIPVRQVLIESRVVIANQDFSKELGVKFGYSKNTIDGVGDFGVAVGGKRPGDIRFPGNTAFHTDNLENFIVDLPTTQVPAAALGLAVGRIGSYLLQLELSALQQEGRGEVISNPRVITANQKEAVIEQGEEIPFQKATSSGATSVEFKKAVLSLRVTPHITPDNRVIMDLAVNKDARGELTPAGPAINTQNVATQVLVDDGETVVLGGVYQQTNANNVDRVPFFSELPYLGNLFKRTQNIRDKTELLIFVTPKILKESLRLSSNP